MILSVDSEALTPLPLVGEDGLRERPSQSLPKQEGSEGQLTERSQGTYYHGVPPPQHSLVRASVPDTPQRQTEGEGQPDFSQVQGVGEGL